MQLPVDAVRRLVLPNALTDTIVLVSPSRLLRCPARRSGYLVSGTAVGSVCLWRLDHVASLMLGGASGSVAAASGSSAAPAAPGSEIVCRVMCSSSDEGVKHLFLRQNQ